MRFDSACVRTIELWLVVASAATRKRRPTLSTFERHWTSQIQAQQHCASDDEQSWTPLLVQLGCDRYGGPMVVKYTFNAPLQTALPLKRALRLLADCCPSRAMHKARYARGQELCIYMRSGHALAMM